MRKVGAGCRTKKCVIALRFAVHELTIIRQDWIHSDEVDVLYEPAEASSTAKADAQQIDRAELLLRKVVAPSDTNALAKACPVCKEKFKSDWSEQDEDWVFYNAVEVDGVVSRFRVLLCGNLADPSLFFRRSTTRLVMQKPLLLASPLACDSTNPLGPVGRRHPRWHLSLQQLRRGRRRLRLDWMEQ